MMRNSTSFHALLTDFLTNYLPLQRGYSRNTILSYRDTFKLLLNYVVKVKKIKLSKFTINDFNRELIIDFLNYYRESGCSVTSANQRLAAIKSFTVYAQLESVELIFPLNEINNIKSKKSYSKEVEYLTVKQISKIVNKPDIHTETGLRHRLVLTLLYDSGCRVQELCDIKVGDVFLNTNSTVKLSGKGNKERTVIISDETGKIIKQYLDKYRKRALMTDPLILNRFHQSIDRDGVAYIVKKYSDEARKYDSSIPDKVHPHMFRHSKAMHMLEAGINIVYIRDFLGHEDISTTMIYVKSDNRLKNEAINKLIPKVIDDFDLPSWKDDNDLMSFLNSLG